MDPVVENGIGAIVKLKTPMKSRNNQHNLKIGIQLLQKSDAIFH